LPETPPPLRAYRDGAFKTKQKQIGL